MPFEDELGAAFQDTARSFRPDLVTLVNGGLADGRRRRRRRTAGILGGVTALAVAAVVGGTVLPGALKDNRSQSDAASVYGTPVPRHPTGPLLSAQWMNSTLAGLLPSGSVFAPAGTGPRGTAAVVLDDGKGAALIDFSLTKVASGGGVPDCPAASTVPNQVCTVRTLPGGGRFVFEQGYEYPTQPTSAKDWSGTVTFADGGQLQLEEWNAPAEKGAADTRKNPPLTAAQVQAVLTAKDWTPALAALPTPAPVAQPPVPGDTTQAHILATLKKLFPKGITLSGESGQPGYVSVELDDGRGPALFQINVQHWDLNSSLSDPNSDASAMFQVFAAATTLGNGDKLLLSQEGAEKGGSGAVQRVADLLQPSGLRVVIMEFNSTAQGTAATRPLPVLTLDQLRAIVTSPLWK